MTIKHIVAVLISLHLVPAAIAQTRACDVPAQLENAQRTPLLNSLAELFRKAPQVGLDCGSLSSVMSKMLQQGRTGGRRLEGDKPLNVAEAREEWQAAMQEPAVAEKLDTFKNAGADNVQFLLFQAALMHEEGHYSARDLVISVLTGQVR